MNERLLARLLYLGLVALSLLATFGPTWSEAGAGWRAVFVASAVAAGAGVALDVEHRRQDKALHLSAGGHNP